MPVTQVRKLDRRRARQARLTGAAVHPVPGIVFVPHPAAPHVGRTLRPRAARTRREVAPQQGADRLEGRPQHPVVDRAEGAQRVEAETKQDLGLVDVADARDAARWSRRTSHIIASGRSGVAHAGSSARPRRDRSVGRCEIDARVLVRTRGSEACAYVEPLGPRLRAGRRRMRPWSRSRIERGCHAHAPLPPRAPPVLRSHAPSIPRCVRRTRRVRPARTGACRAQRPGRPDDSLERRDCAGLGPSTRATTILTRPV